MRAETAGAEGVKIGVREASDSSGPPAERRTDQSAAILMGQPGQGQSAMPSVKVPRSTHTCGIDSFSIATIDMPATQAMKKTSTVQMSISRSATRSGKLTA